MRQNVVHCECGLTFLPSHRPDARRHRKEHDEYLAGVRVSPLRDDEVVSETNDLRITVVRPGSSLRQRKRAEHVGRRANWDTHYDFGVYSASEDGNRTFQIHAFIGSSQERAVSFMLLETRSTVWLARWVDLGANHLEPGKVSEGIKQWTVGFIWVLPRLRRKGIARKLLREAARFAQIPVTELGWYTPFTPEGELLVRAACPDKFRIIR